eukprot:TRINITY_DN6114_c1_g1_i1.p2 TRINITY_DN6114_c1_g1~~TRINITY_DN6114_c1_g1_i1.p2  ORF type:complete len:144 (-),score=10.20 TRINITY_DN6114_c1_g1_i1:123-554(-)
MSQAKETKQENGNKKQSFAAFFVLIPVLVYVFAYLYGNGKIQSYIIGLSQNLNLKLKQNLEVDGKIGLVEFGSPPLYYLPTRNVDKLTHVMEIFSKVGYQIVRTENYTEDWHVTFQHAKKKKNRKSTRLNSSHENQTNIQFFA